MVLFRSLFGIDVPWKWVRSLFKVRFCSRLSQHFQRSKQLWKLAEWALSFQTTVRREYWMKIAYFIFAPSEKKVYVSNKTRLLLPSLLYEKIFFIKNLICVILHFEDIIFLFTQVKNNSITYHIWKKSDGEWYFSLLD